MTGDEEKRETQPSSRGDRNTIEFGGASRKARLSFRTASVEIGRTSAANLIIVLKILAGATCPYKWMQKAKFRNLMVWPIER